MTSCMIDPFFTVKEIYSMPQMQRQFQLFRGQPLSFFPIFVLNAVFNSNNFFGVLELSTHSPKFLVCFLISIEVLQEYFGNGATIIKVNKK